MTAHPESVVGRLRAALSCGSTPEHTEPDAPYQYHAEAIEHAPALLAALEKVWALCDADGSFRLRDCSATYALGLVNEILAPLFLAPEPPSHD